MQVGESRLLQVSIFQTLQNNLSKLHPGVLHLGVMDIANKVDAKLAQQISAYVAESKADHGSIVA
jgi:hypothetical protein